MLPVLTHICVCVLFQGVEDELALALELSRREAQPHQAPAESISSGLPPAATNQPFSKLFNDAAETSSDEDDEDLQTALAMSLSEMDAQQRATVTDFLSGAGLKVKVQSENTGGHKSSGDVKSTNLNAVDNGKSITGDKDGEEQFETGPGPDGRGRTEEPGSSPEPSPASRSPKKKNKCRCVVS